MNAGYVITAGVVAAAVLAAALYQARRRHRAKSRGGFEDWVSDPSYRRAVEAEWERQDKLEPPPDIESTSSRAILTESLTWPSRNGSPSSVCPRSARRVSIASSDSRSS